MKTVKNFGKLSQVHDLREHWPNEANDFTPWLAEENNLNLLGEAIGMELELEGTEQPVGSFKVDILAKETDSDRYIVIENQLEKINHDHLGKLLTYASGYSAKAVIWIAKKICEEHRQTLDWLNDVTSDDVDFFGVEMELWKIGDSQPAPRFNLVSRPNDWFKDVQRVGHKLTETNILQKEFWTDYFDHMQTRNTSLKLMKPRPQSWYPISIGKSGFKIQLIVRTQHKRIGCQLFMRKTECGFSELEKDKEAIEKELNTKLEWKPLLEKKEVRISQFIKGDIQNKDEWKRLHEWLKERAEAFYKTFLLG